MLFTLRHWMYLACALTLSACGGGGGGDSGGGNGRPRYSISVSPFSVTLNGVTNTGDPPPSQRLTVTFNGDGVVVGTRPGEEMPTWLTVTAPTQATSPVTVEITATANIAWNYSGTLRFVTGRADGSETAFVDVPISLNLVRGQSVFADVFGLATGNSIPVSLDNGPPQNTFTYPTFNGRIGVVPAGTPYNMAVTAQPAGQRCTFGGSGEPTLSTIAANADGARHRITCNANLVPWTFMGGARTVRAAAVYGARGIPSTSNTPGARMNSATATDANGNLWLFGGAGVDSLRNDLWRYDTASGTWTWVSGSAETGAVASYGTLNVPASSNVPGSREDAVAWIDANGNFWLYGGRGRSTAPNLLGPLSDLWKYDVAAGMWTWKGGSDQLNTAVVGFPSARARTSVAKDSTGRVWIFGGVSMSTTLNDLWRFDPATETWSLVTSEASYSPVVYGVRGVPDDDNHPGSRADAALWVDANGIVWLFGGAGLKNDLWRYDPSSDQWAWMHGSNVSMSVPWEQSPGVYGPPGASSEYMPASRYDMAYWLDAAGNLWLFGGYGRTAPPFDLDVMNDVWKYTPATNTWSYLSGSNAAVTPGVFGTQGVPSNDNVPTGRLPGATWVDASGRFWMYGGSLDVDMPENLSDLWRLDPQ